MGFSSTIPRDRWSAHGVTRGRCSHFVLIDSGGGLAWGPLRPQNKYVVLLQRHFPWRESINERQSPVYERTWQRERSDPVRGQPLPLGAPSFAPPSGERS